MKTGVLASPPTQSRVAGFFTAVYGWMTLGLGVTAAFALGTAATPAVVTALATWPALLLLLLLAQVALVVVLSARVDRLSGTAAGILFLSYAALTGVTFSLPLLAYTGTTVAAASLGAMGMFAMMATYGAVTQRHLSGLGRLCVMAVGGLVLASLIGIFWKNGVLEFGIAAVGVLAFAGLTASDTQRLEEMALSGEAGDGARAATPATTGALILYLDLINLFVSLLRLVGRRRS